MEEQIELVISKLLYINDMYKVSELLHFIIFADDTNIFYLDKDPTRLINVINGELIKLTLWFRVNLSP